MPVPGLVDRFVVNYGGIEELFMQMFQRFCVSLRNQEQIVTAGLVLFGVRETWRRHVCRSFVRLNVEGGVILIARFDGVV